MNKDGDNPREVIIDPPNIRTNPVKKGPAIDKVLLGGMAYTSVGDPYVPLQGNVSRKEDRAHQIAVGNEKPFKPQSMVKVKVKSAYEHMTDFVEIQKNFRSEENPREVLIQPRNI